MGTFNSPVKSGLRLSTFLGNWKLRGVQVCVIREGGPSTPSLQEGRPRVGAGRSKGDFAETSLDGPEGVQGRLSQQSRAVSVRVKHELNPVESQKVGVFNTRAGVRREIRDNYRS